MMDPFAAPPPPPGDPAAPAETVGPAPSASPGEPAQPGPAAQPGAPAQPAAAALPGDPAQHAEAADEAPGITVDQLLRHITPTAWVTPALAVLILVGFVVEFALGVSVTSPTGGQLLKAGGQFGPAFVDGEWWRTLTSMFLHSGPLHLAFNLWAFWSVGHVTERVFGNRSFLAIYLLSGVGASLTSVAWNPLVVSVGASGAIFGVYGALLAFAVLHRGVFPPEYLAQQRNSIIGFIGYNVFFGLSQKNTDMAAHAGGLVAGALAGAVLARDVLRPAENAGRRLAIAAGLAGLLVLAAFGVRARALKVPEIQADREARSALAHLEAKEYPQAIERYTAALEIERRFEHLFNRGLAYAEIEDLKAARADMREAHRMKPTTQTHAVLCDVGVKLEVLTGTPGQEGPQALDEAADHCSEAIRTTEVPTQKAALLAMRSFARESQKRMDEAHADIDAALALDEHSVLARGHRVSLHLDEEKYAEAEQDCEKLLADPEPRHYDLAICARVSHRLHDRAEERARLDRLLALAPEHRGALHSRAWLNEQEDRLDESLADYGKLLAIAPDLASAWNNRAWIEVELGDFAAARADADRALALAPDAASALGTRCFALVGLGELAAARSDCVRALEIGPGLIDRGMLAFIDKRHADARRDWEEASKANPAQARQLRPWLAKLPAR